MRDGCQPIQPVEEYPLLSRFLFALWIGSVQSALYYCRMATKSKVAPKEITFEQLRKLAVVHAAKAAELLGVHRSNVTRYVTGGVLQGFRCQENLYVLKHEVDKIKRLRTRTAMKADDGKRKPWKQTKRGTLPRHAK